MRGRLQPSAVVLLACLLPACSFRSCVLDDLLSIDEPGPEPIFVVQDRAPSPAAAVFPHGDLNADGFVDVVATAHSSDAGGANSGRVYVFFGGTGLVDRDLNAGATADRTFTGVANEALGYSYAVGDVNGDGISDLVVGAARFDGGGNDRGRVLVFFGGRDFVGRDLSIGQVADRTFSGAAADDRFGTSVEVGDVNGDGFGDVIATAIQAEPGGGTDRGAAYVFFGGPGLVDQDLMAGGAADRVFAGQVDGDTLGFGLEAGDVNGDGIEDLAVGSVGFDAGANTDNGALYVFFGGPGLASQDLGGGGAADLTILPEAFDNIATGGRVEIGDVDGDGMGDLVLAAPVARVYVLFGGPAIASRDLSLLPADRTFTMEATGGLFGVGLALGDVNGDGTLDLLVGAPDTDVNSTDDGRAYVFFGGPGLTSQDLSGGGAADLVYTGANQNQGRFGFHLDAGDYSGDGTTDLLIGAPAFDVGGGVQTGRVYILHGGPTIAGRDFSAGGLADVTLTGAAHNDFFGGTAFCDPFMLLLAMLGLLSLAATPLFGRRRLSPGEVLASARLAWVLLVASTVLWFVGPGPGTPVFEALSLSAGGLAAGEGWRLATGPLVHATLEHMVLDVLTLFLLGCLFESRWGSRRFGAVVAAAALAGGLAGALLRPDLAFVAGVSGLNHALFAAGALHLATVETGWRRRVGVLLALWLAVKIAFELSTGQLWSGQAALGEHGVPIPEVHAACVAAGLAVEALAHRALGRAGLAFCHARRS